MSALNMSFPTTCPNCVEPTGVVCAAGTVVKQPSIVRLTVRCTTCQHEWTMDKEAETLGSMSQISQHPSETTYN